MSALTLCADSNCINRGTCFRYTADPLAAFDGTKTTRSVHVEASFYNVEERSCSKYWPIRLTITEPKTYYEVSF